MSRLFLLPAFAALGVLSACSTTPAADDNFGRSFTTLKAQQTLNSDASRNNDPVRGLDGKAAKGALDNYRDSFRTPPSEANQVIQIGVGQGGGR